MKDNILVHKVGTYLERFRRPSARKLSGALFTQGMLSMTNFIVGFAIAKFATKSEYGLYVVLFSIVGIFGTFQNALVNDPMTVLVAKKDTEGKYAFRAGLFYGQIFFAGLIFCLAILLGALYSWVVGNHEVLIITVVMSSSGFSFMFREYMRTINYSKMRVDLIIRMDMFFVVFIGLAMYGVFLTGNITAVISIVVFGVGYAISGVYEYLISGERYLFSYKSIGSSFKETWEYGKWAMVGVSSDIFKNRGYIYIVSAMLGLEKNAEINAGRLFLMPINLFVASTAKFVLAKGSEIIHLKGTKTLKRNIYEIIAFSLLVWGTYVLVIYFTKGPLISFLGDKYAGVQIYILLWAVYYFIFIMRYHITNALSACREFKAVANYGLIATVFTVSSCIAFSSIWGGKGAVVSLILGESILLIFAGKKFLGSY